MYKITEVHHQFYNEKTKTIENSPVLVEKIVKKFKNKQLALDWFFQPRKYRDFCYGNNYLHNSKTISILEVDEGGDSEIILHKWKDFDKEVIFKYTVSDGNAVNEFSSWQEFYKWLEPIGYVYWKDDTYGRYGNVLDREGQEVGYEVLCAVSY